MDGALVGKDAGVVLLQFLMLRHQLWFGFMQVLLVLHTAAQQCSSVGGLLFWISSAKIYEQTNCSVHTLVQLHSFYSKVMDCLRTWSVIYYCWTTLVVSVPHLSFAANVMNTSWVVMCLDASKRTTMLQSVVSFVLQATSWDPVGRGDAFVTSQVSK